ncbi:hypothetical protein ABTZ59_04785 [Streptomyces sp. NPDC094034]|uniref:hypothetical protein n=1 Tax=Streptomyces sp. NPDC094034 TaxID=3155309 RepID=UPI00333368AB
MSALAQRANDSNSLATIPLHTTEVRMTESPDSVICCPVATAAATVIAFAAGYVAGHTG